MGSEKTSEWVEETMNLIVNTRYNERRHTIFTSNYDDTPDDRRIRTRCKARVGFRMHSRLHEMCEFLEFDGADYRLLPPNGGVDDLLALWKVAERPDAQAAGARQRPGPRPAEAGKRVRLVWWKGRNLGTRRRANSKAELSTLNSPIATRNASSRSASTSTSRSARRSATTAISTAACSTKR